MKTLVARLTTRDVGWERIDWVDLAPMGTVLAMVPLPDLRFWRRTMAANQQDADKAKQTIASGSGQDHGYPKPKPR